jgi:hypothetical protein
MRVGSGVGFLGALAIVAGAWLVLPAHGIAEDTCAPSAPLQPQDVIGITWSGTVAQVRQTGLNDAGIQLWSIRMAVDTVYAHLPDRDFPTGAVLAPGVVFELPSDSCGRKGDMGMRVGQRYLVSTAFVASDGTSIGNLIVWEINGPEAHLVPGLYQTSFVSEQLISVKSVGEALTLVGISGQAAESPAPGESPNRTAEAVPPSTAADSRGAIGLAAVVGLVVAAVALAAWQIRKRQARRTEKAT